jgi:hypothetical protein
MKAYPRKTKSKAEANVKLEREIIGGKVCITIPKKTNPFFSLRFYRFATHQFHDTKIIN